ncbi:MAG: hypothetical protein AAF492_26615, partial [Verrucomicrobiota bacterium]
TQWGTFDEIKKYATMTAKEETDPEPYLVEILQTLFTTNAQIKFEENTHTLIVKSARENFPQIEKLIYAIDAPPPQVLIEARFIEVSVSDVSEIGLEWRLNSPLVTSKKAIVDDGSPTRVPRTQIEQLSDTAPLIQHADFTSGTDASFPFSPRGPGAIPLGSIDTSTKGLNLTFEGVLTEPRFEAILHAIEISGQGRSLSAPRITTVNNNPAVLRHGEDFYYFKEFSVKTTDAVVTNNFLRFTQSLTPDGKAKEQELGITLVAVPSVGADGKTISLLLNPVISRLERFASYHEVGSTNDGFVAIAESETVAKLPVFAHREIQTKVSVESGETVVMGGLIDTVDQDVVNRVPLLSSIPLIGKLFQRNQNTETRVNLLIFVTATVISDTGRSLVPVNNPVKEL